MGYDDTIMPILIREGLVVRVQGLPLDLTREEADKIASVIMAHAAPNPRPVTLPDPWYV